VGWGGERWDREVRGGIGRWKGEVVEGESGAQRGMRG
jgi:hypothetical protein